MHDNNQKLRGKKFLDVMVTLAIDVSYGQKKNDVIESLIDLVHDKNIKTRTRNNIINALQCYHEQYGFSDIFLEEFEEIKAQYLSDRNQFFKEMTAKKPEDIIKAIRGTAHDQTIKKIIAVLTQCNTEERNNYLSFFLGEMLLCYFKHKMITMSEISIFFQKISQIDQNGILLRHFKEIYEISYSSFNDPSLVEDLLKLNSILCEDIAGEWFLFMKEHGNEDIDLLEKEATFLMV